MRLGMIGVGRMGGNMVRRLVAGGHECVVYDTDQENIEAVKSDKVEVAESYADLVKRLDAPRIVWVMLPHGATDGVIEKLMDLLEPGDTAIDGGNTYFKKDIQRYAAFRKKGIHYVDVGTSGGVRGLERGYCLMIGGDREVAQRLEPIFRSLAPGRDVASPTPGRKAGSSTAEEGFLYCGPAGAGHFTKMIHNGSVEYGAMLALAEAFHLLAAAKEKPEKGFQYDFDLPEIAEVWRRNSVVTSWLLDLLAEAFAEDPALERYRGGVDDSGEGRWTIDTAMEEDVSAMIAATALFARLRSHQGSNLADWAVSAMRAKFGGHGKE